MNLSHKNILISWPAHCFMENIIPILHKIQNDYNVYYITSDYEIPKHIFTQLDKLKTKNLLKEYYIIPENNKPFKQFRFFKNILKLKSINFNVWLSMSEMQLSEKFIKDNLLLPECKKIILWTQITYLFENTFLTQNLISNSKTSLDSTYIKKSKNNFLNKVFKKLSTFDIVSICKAVFDQFYGQFKRLRKITKVRLLFLLSKIFYKIYFNKKLYIDKYDTLTQLGSGDMDHILFTDALEVKAHNKLFNNTNVDLVKHTGRGSCRCNSKLINKYKQILTPLSHPNNVDTIPQDELDQYLNAFNIAKKEINFDMVHLRPHPREFGDWPNFLNNYLNKNGINSKVVDTIEPIHNIICNYIGVIGESSCVLRDAANSCDYCFVVGIEKLSFHRYKNPKFVFGDGQNINWIDEFGVYDKSFFLESKNKYYNNEKTIYDFLL